MVALLKPGHDEEGVVGPSASVEVVGAKVVAEHIDAIGQGEAPTGTHLPDRTFLGANLVPTPPPHLRRSRA